MDEYVTQGEPDNYTASDYDPSLDPDSAQNQGVN
jgi:hypothetical protein